MKRFSIIVTFVVFLLTVSCEVNKQIDLEDENNFTLTGKWKLFVYEDLTNLDIEFEPIDIKRSIIISFFDNGKDGIMYGHTVTNQVSGEYSIFKPNQIKVTGFGGTKVGEPPWGNKFWDTITLASLFEVDEEELIIFYNNNKERMIFLKL